MTRIFIGALLCLGAQGASEDKPLRIVVVAQDSPVHWQAQLLGDLDRPVEGSIDLGGQTMEARVDDKGRLELDVKDAGKFRAISKREIVTVAVKGQADKLKTLNVKLEVRKNDKGDWVYRNLTQLRVQIGAEQFVIVDANGNGAYNDPRVDGMAWEGQSWLFPLPDASERWCTPTLDVTGLKMGTLGESPSVQGRPLATVTAAALPILKGINEERVTLGLTPRPEDVKLSAELQKHCKYMAVNGTLTHPEDKGKPGYTAEGHEAGMRSILSSGSPAEAVAAGMVRTYFHRQDVIRPETRAFGVGYEGRYGGIDGRSNMGQAPKHFWPVLCPVPGQTGVGTTYGKEAPDATPGDTAAGFPITAYFGTPKLKLTSHALTELAPNARPAPVECYVLDPQTGASSSFSGYQRAVCVIPKDPLKVNADYEVTLSVDVDGKPWTRTWRFSTHLGKGNER